MGRQFGSSGGNSSSMISFSHSLVVVSNQAKMLEIIFQTLGCQIFFIKHYTGVMKSELTD